MTLARSRILLTTLLCIRATVFVLLLPALAPAIADPTVDPSFSTSPPVGTAPASHSETGTSETSTQLATAFESLVAELRATNPSKADLYAAHYHSALGQYPAAIEYVSSVLDRDRNTSIATAEAYGYLAWIELRRGHLVLARNSQESGKRALQPHAKTALSDSTKHQTTSIDFCRTAILLITTLAAIEAHEGNLKEAIEIWSQSRKLLIGEGMYDENEFGPSRIDLEISQLLERSGDLQKAKQLFEAAAGNLKNLGKGGCPHASLEVVYAYLDRAELRSSLKNYSAAAADLEELQSFNREAFPNGIATCVALVRQAELENARGNSALAKHFHDQLRSIIAESSGELNDEIVREQCAIFSAKRIHEFEKTVLQGSPWVDG